MAANPLDNGGRKRSFSTGTDHSVSRSPRPATRPMPTELDNGGRKHSASNGTQKVAGGNSRNASAPNLAPIPRGYVHNESSFQPSTRKTGQNLKKGVA